jgi:hypothetical protein
MDSSRSCPQGRGGIIRIRIQLRVVLIPYILSVVVLTKRVDGSKITNRSKCHYQLLLVNLFERIEYKLKACRAGKLSGNGDIPLSDLIFH